MIASAACRRHIEPTGFIKGRVMVFITLPIFRSLQKDYSSKSNLCRDGFSLNAPISKSEI